MDDKKYVSDYGYGVLKVPAVDDALQRRRQQQRQQQQ